MRSIFYIFSHWGMIVDDSCIFRRDNHGGEKRTLDMIQQASSFLYIERWIGESETCVTNQSY